MATTLFERFEEGQVVATQASNGVGLGTRLELYASAGDHRDPAVLDPAAASALGRALLAWAFEEAGRRELLRRQR